MNDREKLIAEALTWQMTPYHPEARVKGGGADCLTFIAGAFEFLTGRIEIPHYPPDWHLHQDGERYLEGLLKFCPEVSEPRPGGIALWKIGRCYSHGGIVIKWPIIIHSCRQAGGVVQENVSKTHWLQFRGEGDGKPREVRFFDYWEGK